MMVLETIPYDLTVCKILSTEDLNLESDFFFSGRRMRNCHLHTKLPMPRPEQLPGKTAGGASV